MTGDGGEFESRASARGKDAEIRIWQAELRRAINEERDWRDRAQKIIDRYRDDASRDSATRERFNILWANTEILRAHLLPSSPAPDVRRRQNRGGDESAGRDASTAIERALEYYQDRNDWDQAIDNALLDSLLTGRGVVRLVQDPTIEQRPGAPDPVTGEAPEIDVVTDQELRLEYVHWRDFLLSPARSWSEVRWVAFRHFLTRDQLREFFPDVADEVPLDVKAEGSQDSEELPGSVFQQAEIWEVWDRQNKERLWMSRGFDKFLDREDDPLNIDGFWPMPAPLYSVPTPNTMIPVPEFTLYQDQARELDRVTTRIKNLVEQMKWRGVYAGDEKDSLAKLADASDGEFFPVDFPALMQDKGGLDNAFQAQDLTGIQQALQGLLEQRATLLDTIFQITGISDIVRGQGQTGETATAQRLKGQFAGTRLSKRQLDVQQWLRQAMEKGAAILAEHWQPEILGRISGVQVDQETAALLQREQLREIRVDVEIEATAGPEAEAQRQSRLEFLNTMSGFLQQALPAVQGLPQIAPLAGEMVNFISRSFKAGRGMEDAIQQFTERMQQVAQEQGQDDGQQQIRQLEIQQKQAELAQKQLDIQAKRQEMAAEQQKQIVEQRQKAIELERQGEEFAAKTARENLQALVDMQVKLAEADSSISVREAESEVKQQMQVERERANQRANVDGANGTSSGQSNGKANGG